MRKPKVVAFNGSPRRDGNTSILIRHIFDELEHEGIETELVRVGGQLIRGCTDCRRCYENRDRRCVFDDDIVNDCIGKMIDADGIILGSPVYFLDVTAEMKALIDRAGVVSRANGGLFRRKAGTAAAAVRRSGANHTVDTLLHFMLYSGMIVPGIPAIGIGRDIGDVLKDEEGIARAKEVGKNMAWLLKMMARASQTEEIV
ncbi:FMN reductase [Methanoculleus taiwanensis]|uniref:FMN reductase n=1 Tax=Methanoculleus taiwanensis TaxID=1550565 RepID=A0A498H084_9EURY|nr:flavodoxin family protein [Methanoculleus taiwanensis]RXE56331.1 FMN reductase [Methanoculleus taiwanensis]